MDWRNILKQADSGDPVELERSAFDADPLGRLPEDVSLLVHRDPTLWVSRDGSTVNAEVEWMHRAGYWEHKYSIRVFVEAMMRAVRRLTKEGRPYHDADTEEADPDYFRVSWSIALDARLPGAEIIRAADAAFEQVTIQASVEWAEGFSREFEKEQRDKLPWLRGQDR
jgi:hypothetical protein